MPLHASTITPAEVTDGRSRDVAVRRIVKAIRLAAVTEDIGFRAGRLRAAAPSGRRKPRDLTVDAVVAATALSLIPADDECALVQRVGSCADHG